MQLIFGRSAYAYSHALDTQDDHYLPVIAFMSDDRNLADELGMSGPCNCKDSSKPKVNHVLMRDGSLGEVSLYGAKAVKARNTESIEAAFKAVKPKGNCVLCISDERGEYDSGIYFAWLPLDADMAKLDNGDTFKFSYYSSPFTCSPSRVPMRVFHNYPDAVAQVRKFVTGLESLLEQNALKAEAKRKLVADAAKKHQF